ncbi:hypothetical protein DVV14_07405 [Vibrio coralliilyticus]|nr:hypothetical protein DVV14_07405 [Vibrio coralliilyticus]
MLWLYIERHYSIVAVWSRCFIS